MSKELPTLIDEQSVNFSTEELDLLFDEDESKLEERETALEGIRNFIAARFVQLDRDRQNIEPLLDRMDALERNVKALRRRRERINFRFPDGTRIFDLEVVPK